MSTYSKKPDLIHRTATVSIKLLGRALSSYAARRRRRGSLPYADQVDCLTDIPIDDSGGARSIDIYLPRLPAEPGGHPYVLFVHGGGWISGDRRMAAPIGCILAGHGIAVVAPGYRMAPRYRLSDQLEDLQRASQLVRDNAEQWCLNPERVALAGESAGAHLTMRLVQEHPYGETRPQAIIGLYGMYDLSVWQRHPDRYASRLMLGNLCRDQPIADLVAEQTAYRHLPWTDIPVLLIHGEGDRIASVGESRKLAKLFDEQGVEVSLITYPRVGHAFIYMPSRHPREVESCYQTIIRFLCQYI